MVLGNRWFGIPEIGIWLSMYRRHGWKGPREYTPMNKWERSNQTFKECTCKNETKNKITSETFNHSTSRPCRNWKHLRRYDRDRWPMPLHRSVLKCNCYTSIAVFPYLKLCAKPKGDISLYAETYFITTRKLARRHTKETYYAFRKHFVALQICSHHTVSH